MPQPNFVPVMPSTSRSVHSSGVSCGTSAFTVLPLMFTAGIGTSRYPAGGIPRHRPHDWRPGKIAPGEGQMRGGIYLSSFVRYLEDRDAPTADGVSGLP